MTSFATLRVGRATLAATRRLGLRSMSSKVVPSWATIDPWSMSAATPAVGKNLVGGEWVEAASQHSVIDPLNGEAFLHVPDTSEGEIGAYVERMRSCPRTGLHNPIKNPERYSMLGEVMANGARELHKPDVKEYFSRLIQRVVPKSWAQCQGEPTVVLHQLRARAVQPEARRVGARARHGESEEEIVMPRRPGRRLP